MMFIHCFRLRENVILATTLLLLFLLMVHRMASLLLVHLLYDQNLHVSFEHVTVANNY